MHIIGRGRYAGETYQAPPGGGGGQALPMASWQGLSSVVVAATDPPTEIANTTLIALTGTVRIDGYALVLSNAVSGNARLVEGAAPTIEYGFSIPADGTATLVYSEIRESFAGPLSISLRAACTGEGQQISVLRALLVVTQVQVA